MRVVFFVFGFFINGLCNIVSGACSVDCAKKAEEYGSKGAGKIIALIDGAGSAGSTIGSLILTQTIKAYGWKWGFLMVEVTVLCLAIIPQLIIAIEEIPQVFKLLKARRVEKQIE